MLQRIQTIYLLLAAGISGGLIYILELWKSSEGVSVFADDINYVLAAFLVSAFLSIGSIFRYKNRKSQFMLGRLNIILNFFLLGFFCISISKCIWRNGGF